jgi:orotate phosphoribosyltransferase
VSKLSQTEARAYLKEHNVLRESGHYVYTSGKHGDTYLNKDALLPHVELVSEICEQIASEFVGQGIDAVLGPVAGGVVLSQWVAHHLGKLEGREVLAVYADKRKTEGEFIIRRGYDEMIRGKRILLVDDIINQGSSLKGLQREVARIECEVAGVGCLCNRYESTAEDFGVPKLYSYIEFKLNIYEPESCPLCAQGVPMSKGLGHA